MTSTLRKNMKEKLTSMTSDLLIRDFLTIFANGLSFIIVIVNESVVVFVKLMHLLTNNQKSVNRKYQQKHTLIIIMI